MTTYPIMVTPTPISRRLFIDIETFSPLDLKEVGVYRYTEPVDFSILLFGYAFDDEPVEVVDLANDGNRLPLRVIRALTDAAIIKVAHNANFETVCLNALPSQWLCTMIMAKQIGLPGGLDDCANTLGMAGKNAEGKRLISLFSKPDRYGRRQGRANHPEDWKKFIEYNKQDVELERELYRYLSVFPFNAAEHDLWLVDQGINKRGVRIDTALAKAAIEIAGYANAETYAKLKWITDLNKPTDPAIRKKFDLPSLSADVQAKHPELKTVFKLRNALQKTSIAKYETMLACTGALGRARGLTQFYGAARTGRWSGRLIQTQNLPRITMSGGALHASREAAKAGDSGQLFRLLYQGEETQVLSQLIRTALLPEDGYLFCVADFSAIEARVLAWLADEQWRLDVFNGDGKIYERSAEKMFHLEAGSVGKDSPYRQKGKVAELALGYGGGVGALTRMGALNQGITEQELPGIVQLWRRASPNIEALWKKLDYCIRACLRHEVFPSLPHRLNIGMLNGFLYVELPSRRRLYYALPEFGDRNVHYMGEDSVTHQWGKQELYGAKLTENIVQALARDCLAEVILWCEAQNFNVVFHVHDEVVCEVPESIADKALERLLYIMTQAPAWGEGLPLKGDGFTAPYYRK